MNTAHHSLDWSASSDLHRIVEPLANYICAADKPKTALFSALAVLCREVNGTQGAALHHFRSFVESH